MLITHNLLCCFPDFLSGECWTHGRDRTRVRSCCLVASPVLSIRLPPTKRDIINTASPRHNFLFVRLMSFKFLLLPREVRDAIYAYVVDDIRFRHAFVTSAHQYGAYPKYGNVVRVTLETTPHLNLLLSHSQLYHEYKYAIQTHQRTARVRLDTLSMFHSTKLTTKTHISQ